MTQYNLLRDCYVEALTSSGTGTISLTQSEILRLYDTDTTASGIIIQDTDVLYLDISLYKRTRLDGFYAYINVSGDRAIALNNINFYYKNNDTEAYQLLNKSFDDDKFFALPTTGVFAPKKMVLTVSGLAATLYEVEVINYDYNIAFGEDGTMLEKLLHAGDIYSTIPIYNNSNDPKPATAYVAVQPDSGALCEYVKLSDSADGEYVSIKDTSIGINISDDFTYDFRMGSYVNTAPTSDGSRLKLATIGMVRATPYNTVDIPIDQEAYHGWGTGQNSWDYTDDGDVYTIARPTGNTHLYLYRMNKATEEWYNCGLLDTTGYTLHHTMVMSILGDYVYIMFDRSGNFGRVSLTGGNLVIEPLASCPTLDPYQVVQGMCSDRSRYIYYAALSTYNYDPNKMFSVYDTVNGTWSSLSDGFNGNNGNSYLYFSSRLTLVYDTISSLVYMDCGIYSANAVGFQAYSVATDSWETEWKDHTYAYGHAFSYYGNYLFYCGIGHEYLITIENIITGEMDSFILPYNQNDMGSQDDEHISRILSYPKDDGTIGIVVAGGPNQKLYYFSIGVDTTTTTIGTYTTPVMYMGDFAAASFFNVERTTPSGASLSYGGIENYDSILVRGFDEEPQPFGKIYVALKSNSTSFTIEERDLFNKNNFSSYNLSTETSPFNSNTSSLVIRTVLFDSFNYEFVFYIQDYAYNPNHGRLCRWDLENRSIGSVSDRSNNFLLSSHISRARHLSIDASGNTWLYNGHTLYVFDYDMSYTALEIETSSADFIYEISCSKVSTHCWYSNKAYKKLECVSSDSNKILSISLGNPQNICTLIDGGCAVVDKNTDYIYRYSASGELLGSCPISSAYDISTIKEDLSSPNVVFYWILLTNGTLLRIKEDGDVYGEVLLLSANSITPFAEGVIVNAPEIKMIYQVDLSCSLVYTWNDYSSYSNNSVCGVVYKDYYTLAKEGEDYYITNIDDPVWGKDIDNWQEVKMDGSFFGGKKYYQTKFKLTAEPDIESPSIDSIYFSKAVKIPDIYPGNYKNVYIKTDIPETCEEKEYGCDLRCWWTRREN